MESNDERTPLVSDHSRTEPTSAGLSIAKCCGHVVLLGCGGIAMFVGLILGIAWPFLFNRILQTELALTENSTTLSMWRETPLPMYMDVYMFNWTNPERSLHGPDKPSFVEMGPYVFYEHHSKDNLVWNSNDTITYRNRKIWKFMPELSNGSLSDKVTNLNVVAMTVGEKCRNLNYILKKAANLFISVEEESLVKTNTVGDLLFQGCSDRLLTVADKLKKFLKKPLPYDKFGWFYKRNQSSTSDGVFVMNTGTDDINKLGLLTRWNYKNTTDMYTGNCDKVQGTVGELFPANSATTSDIQLFANDLCSVLTLKAEREIVVNNLTGTLFNASDVFVNKNTCYCPSENCPPDGVRSVVSCKDAPAYISLPHFFNADASYREAVDGMNPDPEMHSFFMVLEQVTSTPLNVRARLQLNILMDTIPKMNFYANINKTYMPMLWFQDRATITNEMAEKLSPLSNLSFYAPFGLFGFAAFGAVLITMGLFLRTTSCCRDQDERLLD